LPYAAIVLAREDWIEAASKGSVRVYHFPKGRRPNAHKLERGSVCLVMKYPAPNAIVGEFEVEEVKLLDHKEYKKWANLMYKPEELKPGEKAYAILFKEFKKYPRPVPKEECTDLRTSGSRVPFSSWVITGFKLIRPQDAAPFIEAVRSKASLKPERPPHNELVEAICELGELLGFVATREHETPGGLYRLDCTWADYEGHSPTKVFEVEVSGDVDRALARLKEAWDKWHPPELYLVVADESSMERARALVEPHLMGSFAGLKGKLSIHGWKEFYDLYKSVSQHADLLKKLSKRP